MLHEVNAIFEKWHIADEAVRAAETALFETALQWFAGMSAPPAPEQAERVKTLRAQANDLFDQTIAKLCERANDTASTLRPAQVPAVTWQGLERAHSK